MINRERMASEFMELVQISSPSRRELPMAQRLIPTLEALGAQVEVDDAGGRIGGDTGNVLGRISGTAPSAPPLLLCAHMDTVVPCQNIRPVAQGDVIRTDGTTVLGGDDKAGIVAILEAVRVARERIGPFGNKWRQRIRGRYRKTPGSRSMTPISLGNTPI